MVDAAAPLTAELEASLLRELMRTWHEVNHGRFHGALHPPSMRLNDTSTYLGRWNHEHRTIEVSRPLVLERPWHAVVEVLKHEMAHQYAHEVLRAFDETAHGAAFQRVCRRFGIDAAASGEPAAADPRRNKLIERVEDLLRLAQSDNPHEAENAAAAAHKIMLKHNISLVEGEPGARKNYAVRTVGEPKGRTSEAEHILAGILTRHFFVQGIWVPAYRPRDGKRGSVLELCGTPENLELAAYVHGFLLDAGERLWTDYKRAHGIRRNRERRRFIAGVMEGFRERLQREQAHHEERGLVWRGDPALQAFYRERHPHVRAVRLQGHGLNQTRQQGREAGRNLVLQRGIKSEASPSRGRALPAAKRG
ncbi:MAG: SprT-like domain-containing protein [Myxococcota bacterium]